MSFKEMLGGKSKIKLFEISSVFLITCERWGLKFFDSQKDCSE